MDCDRVFMELTRGPFPSGAPTDAAVEKHLEECADCWRFAEALRPAHEIFEEAVPASQMHNLPGYWGAAQSSRQAYDQVRTLALKSVATRQASPRPVLRPRPLTDPVRELGWSDVARIGVFGVALVASALVVAWLYQS